jgi:hypothetical protein
MIKQELKLRFMIDRPDTSQFSRTFYLLHGLQLGPSGKKESNMVARRLSFNKLILRILDTAKTKFKISMQGLQTPPTDNKYYPFNEEQVSNAGTTVFECITDVTLLRLKNSIPGNLATSTQDQQTGSIDQKNCHGSALTIIRKNYHSTINIFLTNYIRLYLWYAHHTDNACRYIGTVKDKDELKDKDEPAIAFFYGTEIEKGQVHAAISTDLAEARTQFPPSLFRPLTDLGGSRAGLLAVGPEANLFPGLMTKIASYEEKADDEKGQYPPCESWNMLALYQLLYRQFRVVATEAHEVETKLKLRYLLLLVIWLVRPDILDMQNWSLIKLNRWPSPFPDSLLFKPHQLETLRLLQPASDLTISMIVHRTGSGKTRQICGLAHMFREARIPVMIIVNSEAVRVQTYREMYDMSQSEPANFKFFPPSEFPNPPTIKDTESFMDTARGRLKFMDTWNLHLSSDANTEAVRVVTYSEFKNFCTSTMVKPNDHIQKLELFSENGQLQTDNRVLYIFDEAHTLLDRTNGMSTNKGVIDTLNCIERACLVSATPFGDRIAVNGLQATYEQTYKTLFRNHAPKKLDEMQLVYNGDVELFKKDCVYLQVQADNLYSRLPGFFSYYQEQMGRSPAYDFVKVVASHPSQWLHKYGPRFGHPDIPEADPPFIRAISTYLDRYRTDNVLIMSSGPSYVEKYYQCLSHNKYMQNHSFVAAGVGNSLDFYRKNANNFEVLEKNRTEALINLYSRGGLMESKTPVCLLLNEIQDVAGINLPGFTVAILTSVYDSLSQYIQVLGRINRMADQYKDGRQQVNKIIIMCPDYAPISAKTQTIYKELKKVIQLENMVYNTSLTKKLESSKKVVNLMNVHDDEVAFKQCGEEN